MEVETDILPPRYRSVRPIGHGGMGDIYRATDESLDRDVAVKVLGERFARDEALRTRFRREALAAARLSGEPHTVAIYDVGEWNDRPYIVMEHVPDGTLADRLGSGPVETAQALAWIEQAAEALDAAHEHGVVHRDVKPQNLLVGADGEVRVADFGIASAAGLTSVTVPGTVLGTLGYLAPEQARGEGAGPAADRYALAVVAYELLGGRRPYEDGTGAAEAAAAAHGQVPPISQEHGGLPRSLNPVFRRALAADPDARYPSAAEFVADLRRALEDDAGTTWAAPVPRSSRRRLLPAAVAALLLAAGGATAAVVLGAGGSDPQTRATTAPPSVRTVTRQGSTVTVTTQAQAPPPSSSSAPSTSSSPPPTASSGGATGVELNDAGYQKMQQGDYQGALPLFEQAVQKLQGTGSTAEAYALYNLAFTRFQLGSCDGVLDLLDASQSIQGHRKEIDSLRKQVKKQC